MMRAAPASLDPADRSQSDSIGLRNIAALIFDTLVTTDGSGRIEAALAESWQTAGNRRGEFRIRRNVTFQDGHPLTAEVAASSLRFANASWKVSVDGETVIIERNEDFPDLLSELALQRNAIAERDPDGRLRGTGSFAIGDWTAGKKVSLTAAENCWRGRPFIDNIEIEMGKSFRDQMSALQLGRADLVEVAPEQTHHIAQEGRVLVSSSPIELLALIFLRDAFSDDEKILREALAWSVERTSIREVLLQGSGQPTGGILPTWMSGYGFVFPFSADLTKARQLREQVHSATGWKLGYDSTEPMDRLLAERIALNAKDAGLTLQPMSSGAADARLVRIPLARADPWIALSDFAVQAGLREVQGKANSVEDLYAAEQALLARRRVIPLIHLPVSYVSGSKVRKWKIQTDGSLDLDLAWMESTRP
jgi:peptide/nickel transport system substrate-binding protein